MTAAASEPREDVVAHELILGGQRSGKSRCAEARAAAWLAEPGHSALLIATALPADDEMTSRIERHRLDRAHMIPALVTVEEAVSLAESIRHHANPERIILVDCLTLWLTNLLMAAPSAARPAPNMACMRTALCDSLRYAPGPVVLVSNEIGMGVSPMSPEARHFVDELGRLHQAVAQVCASVTLMVAGIEVAVKRPRAGLSI